MTLTVHKKLAQEITAVFEEMAKMKFPINPACTAGYNWRNMASNKNKQSYHSYGSVIDVNWEHNGATYTGWPYKPGKDKMAVTKKVVAVWKNMAFTGAETGRQLTLIRCILLIQIIKGGRK